MMTVNMGTIDRALRIVAGGALIAFALGYIAPGTGWNWAGWIGVVPIVTALLGNCPAYSIFGISTCPVKQG
jgi:sulfite exporter TauE/SafE